MQNSNHLTNELTPKQIVSELDRFIIGQHQAKKAVAIALRNRFRRKQVAEDLREEIMPKNILMVGPTGVGKTEIARRLAKLANAPFIKVEATKFTEVGYVGRDVESIIRDLVEVAVNIIRTKSKKQVTQKAKNLAQERILDILVGESASFDTKEKFRVMLENNELDDKIIEINIKESSSSLPTFDVPGMPGGQMGVINISDMISKTFGSNKTKLKKLTILEAKKILLNEESDKLIEEDKINEQAINLVENDGIVFIDEIDKIAARIESKGSEVSREGVQRDLLPLIEGTSVTTKYGIIKTDHILFIASGAFHMAKPADLLPELQGRLPIRVSLTALSEQDMIRILTEPEASLLKQYIALLATERVKIEFSESGIEQIAKLATLINKEVENIGARRLHTIMERLLEDISYNASELIDQSINIDAKYVNNSLADLSTQTDLSRFIL